MWGDNVMDNILLEEKEKNLLLFSEYIKNVEGLDNLISLMSNNKDIKASMCGNVDMINLILDNKSIWLEFSTKEWSLRRNNPIIVNPKTEQIDWKKCALCGQPNKKEFYIVNKQNEKTINVGGSCVGKFMGEEIGYLSTSVIKNPKAAIRYEYLKKRYPDVKDVLIIDKTYLDHTPYLLTLHDENTFKKQRNKVKRLLNRYLNKNDVQINDLLLKEELKRYRELKKNHKIYFSQCKSWDSWRVSRKLWSEIKKSNKDNCEEIFERVQKNAGKIDFSSAIQIKAPMFLQTIMSKFNEKNFDKVEIESFFDGVFVINISEGMMKYRFKIPSSDLIRAYGQSLFYKRPGEILEVFYRLNNTKMTAYDSMTSKLLAQIAELELEKTKGFFEFEVEYENLFKVKKHQDVQLDDRKNKYDSILSNYVLYQKRNDSKVYVLTNESLTKYGKSLLYCNKNNIETNLAGIFLEIKTFETEQFYSFIKEQYEFAKMV